MNTPKSLTLSRSACATALLFAIVATLGSSGMLWNMLDTTGLAPRIGARWCLAIVALFVAGSIPGLFAMMIGLQKLSLAWPMRSTTNLALALLAFMVVVQVLGYLFLGSVKFLGSERDDIQYGAVRTLLDGHNPYAFIIPWGAQNSILPGMLLLEVPFVVTGSLFLMHFVVLAGLLAAGRLARWESTPVLAVMAAMLAMPVVWRQSFPEGGELLTGDLLLVFVLATACGSFRLRSGHRRALYVAWGVLLCAKLSYFCIWPLLIRMIAGRSGLKEASWAAFLSGLSAFLVVAAFFVPAPDVFAPLETSDFVALYNQFVPGAGKGVLMALAASIIWAVAAPAPQRDEVWFLRAALIMAVPVLPIFVLPLAHGDIFAPHWWPTYLLPAALLTAWAASLACRPAQADGIALPAVPRVFQAIALAAAVIVIALTPLGEMKSPDPLMTAVDGKNLESARQLVAGRDLNKALGMRSPHTNAGRFGREAPLVQASRRGSLETVELLLKSGASIRTGRNAYALCAAEFYRWQPVVDRLLAAGASRDIWCGKKRARDP